MQVRGELWRRGPQQAHRTGTGADRLCRWVEDVWVEELGRGIGYDFDQNVLKFITPLVFTPLQRW